VSAALLADDALLDPACALVRLALVARVRARLPASEVERLAAHLDGCADCAHAAAAIADACWDGRASGKVRHVVRLS
jgi:hypothetical protein